MRVGSEVKTKLKMFESPSYYEFPVSLARDPHGTSADEDYEYLRDYLKSQKVKFRLTRRSDKVAGVELKGVTPEQYRQIRIDCEDVDAMFDIKDGDDEDGWEESLFKTKKTEDLGTEVQQGLNKVQFIRSLIADEVEAIEGYEKAKTYEGVFTDDELKKLDKIIADEKDHIVDLTNMLNKLVGKDDKKTEAVDESSSPFRMGAIVKHNKTGKRGLIIKSYGREVDVEWDNGDESRVQIDFLELIQHSPGYKNESITKSKLRLFN